jgi:hypothetical protein
MHEHNGRGVAGPFVHIVDSHPVHRDVATADFAAALSDVRTEVLDGQGHTANESMPQLVADRVAEFLRQVGK